MMSPLRGIPLRTARSLTCSQCRRTLHSQRIFTSRTISAYNFTSSPRSTLRASTYASSLPIQRRRPYTTPSTADSIIEGIQEQYATTKDEFEIAMEETEKKTVYAADDREAAKGEMSKLKRMYDEVLEGPNGEEVKRRVGSRIRELENAIKAMDELALED